MSAWNKTLALIAFTLPFSGHAAPCVSTWTEVTNSNWNTLSNWGGTCISGTQTTSDQATFSGAPADPFVNLDIPTVTLSSLTLSVTDPTFTIQEPVIPPSPLNFISFQSPTSTITLTTATDQTINVPVVLSNTNMTMLFTPVSPTATLNLTGGLTFQSNSLLNIVASGVTTSSTLNVTTDLTVDASQITNNSGMFTTFQNFAINNSSLNNFNTVHQGVGAILQVNSLTSSESNVIVQNSVLVSGSVAANAGSNLLSSEDITATNTNIELLNTGHIINEGEGSLISSGNNITLTNSMLSQINTGSITNGGFGTTISGQNLTLNNSFLNVQNLEGFTGVFGKTIQGNTINLGGDLTLNSGQFNVSNTGSMHNNVSGNFFSINNFTIASGSFSIDNSGNIVGPTSFGNTLDINNNFSISSANIALSNEGNVSNQSDGTTVTVTTDFDTMNSTIMISNTGTVHNLSNGVLLSANNNISLTNTNLSMINTGSIATQATGCLFSANNQLTINGGSILNQNTGSVTGSDSFGSLIESPLISITGGTFENDATVQSSLISIQDGGILAGNGIFLPFAGSLNVINSGTVEPGSIESNTPGTMTIQGNYQQAPSGTFLVNIKSPTAFSHLNVTNTASLNGNLEVTLMDNFDIIPGQELDILTASDGVQGIFANIINDTRNFTLQVKYTSDDVFITFFPTLPSYIGGFTEALFSSVNLINIRLSTEMERIRGHFSRNDQMKSSKKVTSRFQEDIFQMEKHPFEMEGAYIRLASNDPLEMGDNLSSLELNENLFSLGETEEKQEQLRREITSEEKERPWNLYAGPLARAGKVQKKENQTGLGYWSVGGLVGFDYAFEEVGLGLLANYERISGRASQFGHMTIDELHASLYATYAPLTDLAINAIIGGGYELYDIYRKTGTALHKIVAKGDPNGAEFDALLGLEYAVQYKPNKESELERMQFIPLASIQYIHLNIDEYKEHGADLFEMKINGQRAKSLRTTLGLRTNYFYIQNDVVSFTPELLIAWQREFLDKERSVQFSPISFIENGGTIVMPKSGRNTAILGVDFLTMLYNKYGLEANYNFEWNRLFHDHFFYVGFNARF